MEGLAHYEKEERPWGTFERFTLNERSTVKLITIRAGEAFSSQTHEHRDEFWRIVSGSGSVRIAGKTHDARVGNAFFAPRHSEHQATGGAEGLVLLEIAFGDFDESDIKRLEDRYGRTEHPGQSAGE